MHEFATVLTIGLVAAGGYVTTGVFTVQPAGATDVLGSGQGLYPGQGVFSTDGRFGLIYQGDGNLVLYAPNGVPLWWTGVVGPPGVTMMQTDGDLVILSNGTDVWQTGTAGHPGAYMRVQSDGNLVLVSAGGVVLMSTGTGGGEPEAVWSAGAPTGVTPASTAIEPAVAKASANEPEADGSSSEHGRGRAGIALMLDGPRGPSGGGHAGATQVERVNRPGGIAARVPAAFGVWGVVLACGALVALVRGAGAGAKARWRRRRARRRIAAWRVATLVALAVVLTALVPAEAEAQQSDVVEPSRRAWHRLQHESPWQLLPQRGHGELLLHGQVRARRTVRQPRVRQNGVVRLHRSVL